MWMTWNWRAKPSTVAGPCDLTHVIFTGPAYSRHPCAWQERESRDRPRAGSPSQVDFGSLLLSDPLMLGTRTHRSALITSLNAWSASAIPAGGAPLPSPFACLSKREGVGSGSKAEMTRGVQQRRDRFRVNLTKAVGL